LRCNHKAILKRLRCDHFATAIGMFATRLRGDGKAIAM
jgi:hypothetical protein